MLRRLFADNKTNYDKGGRGKSEPRAEERRTQSPSRLSAVAVAVEISGIKLREIGDKRRRIELADELMSEILFSGSTILNSFTVKK